MTMVVILVIKYSLFYKTVQCLLIKLITVFLFLPFVLSLGELVK